MEVTPAVGATMAIRCFSATSATASLMPDEKGPRIASTLSCVMSFS